MHQGSMYDVLGSGEKNYCYLHGGDGLQCDCILRLSSVPSPGCLQAKGCRMLL